MLAAALLVPLLAACSGVFVSGGGGTPVLVNRTGHALLYVAFGLSQAALVDPSPALDPASAPERLVPDGDQRPITLAEEDGEGLVLFIYDIPVADRAGPVPLSRTVRLTHDELLRMNHRIVLDAQ